MMLVNMRDGGFISAYDFEVGGASRACSAAARSSRAASSTRRGCSKLERSEFMALLHDERTQARIAHTLATGKPLRN